MKKDRDYYKNLNKAKRMIKMGWHTVSMYDGDSDFLVFCFQEMHYGEYCKFVQKQWDQRKQKRLELKLAEVAEGCGVENKRRM